MQSSFPFLDSNGVFDPSPSAFPAPDFKLLSELPEGVVAPALYETFHEQHPSWTTFQLEGGYLRSLLSAGRIAARSARTPELSLMVKNMPFLRARLKDIAGFHSAAAALDGNDAIAYLFGFALGNGPKKWVDGLNSGLFSTYDGDVFSTSSTLRLHQDANAETPTHQAPFRNVEQVCHSNGQSYYPRPGSLYKPTAQIKDLAESILKLNESTLLKMDTEGSQPFVVKSRFMYLLLSSIGSVLVNTAIASIANDLHATAATGVLECISTPNGFAFANSGLDVALLLQKVQMEMNKKFPGMDVVFTLDQNPYALDKKALAAPHTADHRLGSLGKRKIDSAMTLADVAPTL